MNRAQRFIRLLDILSEVVRHPGQHPAELAAACRVSERTLRRDLHELRRLGFELGYLDGYQLQGRLNLDGSIPPDNPIIAGVRSHIYSYGHRNPQGLAWQPGTKRLYSTEHGPSGFQGCCRDELNYIEPGKNYGWPVIHHRATHEGMESPILEYTPACAPASGMFYRGSQFPQFKGNFFFGCLVGERIIRVVTNGRQVVNQENLLERKYGRIRDVAEGPDGYIYFSTSNRDGRGSPASDDDRILRLVPVR